MGLWNQFEESDMLSKIDSLVIRVSVFQFGHYTVVTQPPSTCVGISAPLRLVA